MNLPIGTRLRAVCLTLLVVGGSAFAESPSNELSVDALRVQQYLDTAFPYEYEALGGLFTLTARDPVLTIPASGQRLLMAFSASAARPAAAICRWDAFR